MISATVRSPKPSGWSVNVARAAKPATDRLMSSIGQPKLLAAKFQQIAAWLWPGSLL